MKDERATILENTLIAADTWRMVLQADLCRELKAGQFLNLLVPGFTLRRPISVASYDKDAGECTLLYKVLGDGTRKMAEMKAGESVQVIGPLGNGFPVETAESVLLIGGGAGTGPLIQLGKELKAAGCRKVRAVLGFPTKADVYGVEEFGELGIRTHVSTDDGTYGFHGNAVELIRAEGLSADLVYTCGPKRMMQAVEELFDRGYISLDIRMACGMGACMGCVVKDKADPDRYYRVCKEGPVFRIGQVEY